MFVKMYSVKPFPACTKKISLPHVERPQGALPTTVKKILMDCLKQNNKNNCCFVKKQFNGMLRDPKW
jgi:hypothetical protein